MLLLSALLLLLLCAAAGGGVRTAQLYTSCLPRTTWLATCRGSDHCRGPAAASHQLLPSSRGGGGGDGACPCRYSDEALVMECQALVDCDGALGSAFGRHVWALLASTARDRWGERYGLRELPQAQRMKAAQPFLTSTALARRSSSKARLTEMALCCLLPAPAIAARHWMDATSLLTSSAATVRRIYVRGCAGRPQRYSCAQPVCGLMCFNQHAWKVGGKATPGNSTRVAKPTKPRSTVFGSASY